MITKGSPAGVDENADMSDDTTGSKALPTHTGDVCLRSNITAERSWQKVPGDLVTQYYPNWFDERAREYSDWQKQEWVYYKDCPSTVPNVNRTKSYVRQDGLGHDDRLQRK